MAAPAYKDLVDERKAIAALLGTPKGRTNVEVLQERLNAPASGTEQITMLQARVQELETQLNARVHEPVSIGDVPAFVQPPVVAVRPDHDGITNPPQMPTPVPMPNWLPQTDASLPAMQSALGDMTPGYAEAFLAVKGPAATAEQYKGRFHLLPLSVKSQLPKE